MLNAASRPPLADSIRNRAARTRIPSIAEYAGALQIAFAKPQRTTKRPISRNCDSGRPSERHFNVSRRDLRIRESEQCHPHQTQ